jgi:hypothetical protein
LRHLELAALVPGAGWETTYSGISETAEVLGAPAFSRNNIVT